MIVLVALAIICLALVICLRKGPSRPFPGSGFLMWRGRQLTEDDAARMTRATLDRKASALKDKV